MTNLWKFIIYSFAFFGIDVPLKKRNRMRGAFKKCLRMFWDATAISFFIILFFNCIRGTVKVFYVHISDVFLLYGLRVVLFTRIKNISACYKNTSCFLQLFSLKREKIVMFLFQIYCFAQICRATANQVRMVNSKIINLLEEGFSFNFSYNGNAVFRVFLNFSLNCATLYHDLLPFLTTIMCCSIYICTQQMISNFNRKIHMFVINKPSPDIIMNLGKELLKIKEMAKEINQLLSPIIFILVGFWVTNICYTISKIIFRPIYFASNFATCMAFLNLLCHICEFITLVVLAANIEDEIIESKNFLFKFPARNDGNMFDIGSIQLFALMLDNTREEISVTALGMFKLDRGIILVVLGIIATYEVIIIQMLMNI